MSGSLRLTSFLGTQLVVPLARVLDALIQISLRGATAPLRRPALIRNKPVAAVDKPTRRAGSAIGNQMAGAWFHT